MYGAGQKSLGDVGRRAGQVGPQAARVGDRELDADRAVLRPHRVGRRRCRRATRRSGRRRCRTGRPAGCTSSSSPICGAEDRRELRVQLVDLGLDRRRRASRRCSTACGSRRSCRRRPRCSGPITRRTRVKRMPLLRFSVTSTPFGRVVMHLEVGVVADHGVDVADVVGQVDERARSGRSASRPSRPGGRSRRWRRPVLRRSVAASALTAVGRVRDVERAERCPGRSASGRSSFEKPMMPSFTPSERRTRATATTRAVSCRSASTMFEERNG